MRLTPGTKLGPYEIASTLGAGGMGEVYRARDMRLDRIVAIKVLPTHLSDDPELKARFDREARTISSLSHPHICTLYDVGYQGGTDFLVMEYLEGETLALKLEKGPLPIERVLKIGAEIAGALDKAHRSGVIHRDLKPGNIMLTKAGAKLMDFGLAKAPSAAVGGFAEAAGAAISPTIAANPITQRGTLLGTFQYMSPEQLDGKDADARSDVFAFGAVLYEMVTGKRAFDGDSTITVASNILGKEPEPISRLQPMTPPALEHVVRRALAKDPEERWQSAADLKSELQWIAQAGSDQPLPSPGRTRNRWVLVAPLIALAVLVAAAVIFGYSSWRQHPLVLQAAIMPPENTSFVVTEDDYSGPAVISPQNSILAFTARDSSGKRQVWLRSLSEAQARPLPGTENGSYPFWSPDGKSLGFYADGRLKIIALAGGPAVDICNVQRPRGGSWGRDGTILFTPDTASVIYLVSAQPGSAPRSVTTLDTSHHSTHRWPYLLPDGKHFLYLASSHTAPGASASNGIYVASIDGQENRFLLPSDSNAILAGPNLLFVQNGALMAQPFDVSRQRLTGDPVAIAQNVYRHRGTWRAAFDASGTGVLVFYSTSTEPGSRLLWFGRDGKPLGNVGPRDQYWDIRLSRDAHKLAASAGEPAHILSVFDLQREVQSHFTFETTGDYTPVWSRDGKYLYFAQRDPVILNLFRKELSGTGKQERVYASDTNKYADDVSPDGRFLLFEQSATNQRNTVWVLPLEGERKPYPLLPNAPPIYMARFSPDGKWVVYASRESGRPELYITSFTHGGKWQLSTSGGWAPKWRADGKAIFYSTLGSGATIMEGVVDAKGDAAQIGPQKALFKSDSVAVGSWNVGFDAAPDGSRFLVNTAEAETPRPLTLVVNWNALLKK